MIFDPIERLLWGVAIIVFFICGLQYLIVGNKKEEIDEKLISIGFSAFFFCWAIARIILFLADYQIPGTYLNHIYYGSYDNISSSYEILFKFSWNFTLIGFIFLIYPFERIIKRTKFSLTIINIIAVILVILLPFDIMKSFVEIYYYGIIIVFIVILLLYTKWSRIEFKAVSAFILLGFLILEVGKSIAYLDAKKLNIVPLIISPILCILGAFICLIPALINPEMFSRALKYWKITVVLDISILCVIGFFFILFEFHINYIIMCLMSIPFIIFSFLFTLKTVKLQLRLEKKGKFKDVLSVFTRPKKVTEEEVSVSKEKKICLVCKGRVSRYNIYICPECDSLYCEKCAKSLEWLENACWVCNTPFDESKSVKLPDREEAKIVSEEEGRKKAK